MPCPGLKPGARHKNNFVVPAFELLFSCIGVALFSDITLLSFYLSVDKMSIYLQQ